MRKVTLAFYNGHFPESAFEFIRRMNESAAVVVTGIALEKAAVDLLPVYPDGTVGMFLPIIDNTPDTPHTAIKRFEVLCRINRMQYQCLESVSENGLIEKESIFSNLLVMGGDMITCNGQPGTIDTQMEDLLHHSSCPVVLIPENFTFPTSLVLAYDGSRDSVFAIRQFTVLFPELLELNTLLAFISKDKEAEIPNEKEIGNLATAHFSKLTFCTMESKKAFAAWIRERTNTLLVSGSYGRAALSQMIRKSFARNIIAGSQTPVFIAHM